MNLRALDLNLLVILSVLLDEAHVTRASNRLGLSQPATSSALDRCRAVFGDALLERGSRGMRLTPKAESLKQPLAAIIAEVKALVDDRPVDVSAVVQTVDVTMADLPGVGIISDTFNRLAETAPGIKLVVRPWRGAEDAMDALQGGSIDLAVAVFMRLKEPFHGRQLSEESFSVVARKGHPGLRRLDLDRWLSYPHVLVSGHGSRSSPVDEGLAAQGLVRSIGIVVPTFLMVPPLLRESDLMALVPTRAIAMGGFEGLAIKPPPIVIPAFPLHVAWHRRRDQDVAVQHVASVIEQALHGVAARQHVSGR